MITHTVYSKRINNQIQCYLHLHPVVFLMHSSQGASFQARLVTLGLNGNNVPYTKG